VHKVKFKIVIRSLLLLLSFSVVNAADENKEESVIGKLHKANSVVSIAVSNVFLGTVNKLGF
jgi:hypothetical protein